LKRLLYTLYIIYTALIATPIWVAITIIVSLVVVIAAFCGDTRWTSYWLPRLWSKSACILYLVRVKVEGKEHLDHRQSYIFLANHQGYFDIFLIYGYLGWPFKWMMKEYLRKIPFVGYACLKSKQIYVGETRASITHAVRMAEETLTDGMSMTIFPEGTRTSDGRLGPFKRGAFMLANEINLPIVPITINGSYDILNRTAKWVHWGCMKMTIHKPITPADREGMDSKAVMQQVWNTINSDLNNN